MSKPVKLFLARDNTETAPAWLYSHKPRKEGSEFVPMAGETTGPLLLPQDIVNKLPVDPGEVRVCTITLGKAV